MTYDIWHHLMTSGLLGHFVGVEVGVRVASVRDMTKYIYQGVLHKYIYQGVQYYSLCM